MTEAYIDSMSTWEIISSFHHKHPNQCYPWAWKTAIELTYSLISTNHVRMAPAPAIVYGAKGYQTNLMSDLNEVIAQLRPTSEQGKTILEKTSIWAHENTSQLSTVLKQIFNDDVNFHQWLNNAINHALQEHSSRLGGLFNRDFIPQIAKVLKVENKVLEDIWKLSCDNEKLHYFSQERPDEYEYELMIKSYVLAAIIRGRFHENIANESNVQIIQHPLREMIHQLNESTEKIFEHSVPNTRLYLANIIVASSFAEKKVENRIKCWCENIKKSRVATLNRDFDLSHKDNDNVAKSRAVECAKILGIRTHSTFIEYAFEITAVISVSILSSFVLQPWISAVSSVGIGMMSAKKPIGKRLSRSIFERNSRLSDLADAGPGKIKRVWL